MENSYPTRHDFHVVMEGQPSHPPACWNSYNMTPWFHYQNSGFKLNTPGRSDSLISNHINLHVRYPPTGMCYRVRTEEGHLSARKQSLKANPKEQSLGQRKFSRAFKFNFSHTLSLLPAQPIYPQSDLIILHPVYLGLRKEKWADQNLHFWKFNIKAIDTNSPITLKNPKLQINCSHQSLTKGYGHRWMVCH